jgi:sirohydrochlorin cobaltochelatase
MNPPIVLVAFGTTSRSMKTYDAMDARFRKRFQEHEIHWAYTSRMVSHALKKNRNIHRPSPEEVLTSLAGQGHDWAVVQSLHVICGHEFYRLVSDVGRQAVRASMGLPLLCTPEDHHAMADTLASVITRDKNEAVVFVGHGTDHPAWTAYTALAHRMQGLYGPKVYVGVVEEGYPDRSTIIAQLARSGYSKVRLLPLMLVAGVHFEEDLAGDDDSWKTACEDAGLHV